MHSAPELDTRAVRPPVDSAAIEFGNRRVDQRSTISGTRLVAADDTWLLGQLRNDLERLIDIERGAAELVKR
ncbi:MAG: hypothetical protein ACRDST_06995 [Pseudonocardiaceae bacterium]